MSPEELWRWAQIKGISVIGTGDFTHPGWLKELREKLSPAGNGLFRLRREHEPAGVPASCGADVSFLLSAEISCIYRKGEKTRKVHCIVFMPDFASAERLNRELAKRGNLAADGRPILGLDAKVLLRKALDASDRAMLVPAHAWTPHFSVFGASSGFDSLEECFDELTPHIHAIETGLSSDPAMNWRLSQLDSVTLISNSDAHSPAKIGREANIFDTERSYQGIAAALATREGFAGTIEFFPEEGKYHYDGHRACGVSLEPQESIRQNLLCPVCGKKLTIGVMHRVELLADRESGIQPLHAPPYRSIIPLAEVIAEALGKGAASKAVTTAYFSLIEKLGTEFHILLDAAAEEIAAAEVPRLAEAISRMREGRVNIAPGYDGEFGKIRILHAVEERKVRGQAPFF